MTHRRIGGLDADQDFARPRTMQRFRWDRLVDIPFRIYFADLRGVAALQGLALQAGWTLVLISLGRLAMERMMREAGLEFREDIETVLKPGMVVSIEPMIMIPEGMPGAGGYREHDILVVTENGALNITGFPFGPEHNIIQR